MKRRILEAACIAGLLSLTLTASASAGKYHVYACKTPSGEVAPTDGWSDSTRGSWDVSAFDSCPLGDGALVAALGDQTTHVAEYDSASWTFSAPAPERMVNATLWRAGDADGGSTEQNSYEFSITDPGEVGFIERCRYWSGCTGGLGDFADPFSPANRVEASSDDPESHLSLSASCEGTEHSECPAGHGDSEGAAAVAYLYAADVLLEQVEGPIVREVSGPLTTEPTVQGTSDVAFSAQDPGAGVWEVTFSIDGKVVQSVVPNENGGRCKDVGQTTDGLPAFLYLQPCLKSVGADVPFNTTAVSNGHHHLVVSVTDAADNSAPVLEREITIANPAPALPAAPATPATPAGSGNVALLGPAVPLPASPLLPAGSEPAVRSTLPRLAGARVTLRVALGSVGRHRKVRFVGRLLGGHIPGAGKKLVLQERLRGGSWIEIAVLRTGADGRFRADYPSEFILPGRTRFRVLCEAAQGYPFATGTSNVVAVRVSPR